MDRRLDDTTFGQFPEATLEGFVAAIDTLTQQASAISGLPPAYFGIHGSKVASTDAIRSSGATLVSKARRRQQAFGGAWEDVMRLAVLVRDGIQRPCTGSLETIWRNPETRTVAQAADVAVEKLAVGVSRELVLETSLQPCSDRAHDQQPHARIRRPHRRLGVTVTENKEQTSTADEEG